MIKNYIKIAWRNITKNKMYSVINIGGLAVGLAVAMLIGLWVWDELSFNKSFVNYDKLGQVQMYQTFNGERGPQLAIPLPLKKELEKYPDFEEISLASWNSEHIIANGDAKFFRNGMYVEPAFTKMMSLEMTQGIQNGLDDVHVIMLSESLAKSLFREENPIHKTIKIDNKDDLSVTGVYKDFPKNSGFSDVGHLLSWKYYEARSSWVKNSMTEWNDNSWQCYVQMAQTSNPEKVHSKIRDIVLNNVNNDRKLANPEVFIHPMSDWHLYSGVENGKMSGGRIQYVWLFGFIGLFVLILACINFMNLSTAQSEKRAKEVGIRKAVGSVRSQLINQFMSESMLTVFISFLLSLLLVFALKPWFSDLAGKTLNLPYLNVNFWIISIAFLGMTGLLAGSYPALFLSSFNTIQTLKGKLALGRFAALPRKIMVVTQFTVSVTLIIGTIIILRQIQYAKNRPLGYDTNNLIYVHMNTPELRSANFETVKSELMQTGVVENVSKSSSPVTDDWSNNSDFQWQGKDLNSHPLFNTVSINHEFASTVGMEFIQGRDFSKSFASDSAGLIINETAARVMGFEDPIGQYVTRGGFEKLQIIGVVKDMITGSPYENQRPSLYFIDKYWYSLYTIKLKASESPSVAIAKLVEAFKKLNPGSPFTYSFADMEYSKKFSSEERIGKLAGFFAILAIFISCLGIFGLASFIAEQRTKEIGVRKVLGASVSHLWQLLTKDFLQLVMISCLIAIPIAYYYLSGWLDAYQYHTEMSWWIFVASSLGAMGITLFTVSFQAIKASLMNPVNSLKSE
ncbi:MAG: ABC transporter permease [Saprospiraceae bacterium]|nr:ABC transporter permease [Saprospiraceae bacterium]